MPIPAPIGCIGSVQSEIPLNSFDVNLKYPMTALAAATVPCPNTPMSSIILCPPEKLYRVPATSLSTVVALLVSVPALALCCGCPGGMFETTREQPPSGALVFATNGVIYALICSPPFVGAPTAYFSLPRLIDVPIYVDTIALIGLTKI